MPLPTISTALFYPYIARERTAQNLILSVRSERSALRLKERHRSQNEGSLKSEERLSNFKERYAQHWIYVYLYNKRESKHLFRLPFVGHGIPWICPKIGPMVSRIPGS